MYKEKKPAQCKPIGSWTRDEFVKEIESQFVYSDSMARVLYNALVHEKNVLAHGPKGHAKSEVVEFALRMILTPEEFDRDVYLVACGSKMRSEPFEGFQSLPDFKEGRYVTIMDQSVFVTKKYIVMDEGLAAPAQLLLFLRDAISRKKICANDGICHRVITKNIFLCTNVDPQTWVDNAGDADDQRSRDSFLDRFQYRKHVVWPAYEAENFDALFLNQTGDSVAAWAEMCQETRKLIPTFSPRSALAGLHLYLDGGLSGLEAFDGATDEVFRMWETIELARGYIERATKLALESVELEKRLNSPTITGEEARIINARTNKLLGDWGKLNIPKDARLYEAIGITKKRLLDVSGRSYAKGFEEAEEQPTAIMI